MSTTKDNLDFYFNCALQDHYPNKSLSRKTYSSPDSPVSLRPSGGDILGLESGVAFVHQLGVDRLQHVQLLHQVCRRPGRAQAQGPQLLWYTLMFGILWLSLLF